MPTQANSLNARLVHWLRKFLPTQLQIDYREKLRACSGILGGLLITGMATRIMTGSDTSLPVLIAPIGASAVLLFGVPSSPLAQPWSIVGGM
jgi:CBS domain-containing membrane protein